MEEMKSNGCVRIKDNYTTNPFSSPYTNTTVASRFYRQDTQNAGTP